MKKPKLSKTSLDDQIAALALQVNHRLLAIWGADCAERVLPFFEARSPQDSRPRYAISATRTWVETGIFQMANVLPDSLAARAAARSVAKDDAARPAARTARCFDFACCSFSSMSLAVSAPD